MHGMNNFKIISVNGPDQNVLLEFDLGSYGTITYAIDLHIFPQKQISVQVNCTCKNVHTSLLFNNFNFKKMQRNNYVPFNNRLACLC
jgi:hypothetical protein